MQFDYVDVIYANPPADGLDLDTPDLDTMVHDVAGLVDSGRARAWAIVNWPADQLLAVSGAATRAGLPQPCGAQLPYSLVHRSWVEDDAMTRALDACTAPVVASFVLAGGVLSGKYDTEAASELDAVMTKLQIEASGLKVPGDDVASLVSILVPPPSNGP